MRCLQGRIATEDVLIWPHLHDGGISANRVTGFSRRKLSWINLLCTPDLTQNYGKEFWALRVPNKVKNFLWRTCRNALPTKDILVRRTIIDDPLCSRCHEEHETPLHALWLCRELDPVWPCSGSWSFRRRLQFLDF